jgi:hypothetical protein
MDLRFSVLVCLLAAIPAHAQLRGGDGERAARPATAPAGDVTRSAPARRHRWQPSDRCANFRAELRDARRAEREALTTTQSDQASLRRQRLLEQSQKAGC